MSRADFLGVVQQALAIHGDRGRPAAGSRAGAPPPPTSKPWPWRWSRSCAAAPQQLGDSFRATPEPLPPHRRAQRHLLAAAAAGQQTHAGLHQPHVQLGVHLPARAMQRDLRAAAQAEPKGATTTGRGQNLMDAVILWKARIARSTSSHSSSWMLSSSCIRLAPTEKLLGVAADHEGLEVAHRIAIRARSVSVTMRTMSSPMAFFFECSSRQADTVAQIDQRGAGVLLHHAVRRPEVGDTPDALDFGNRR